MATKLENDFPPSPHESDEDEEEPDLDASDAAEDSVARILKQLQNSGALVKKPKDEYYCRTCSEDFPDWPQLEHHLLRHVTLPELILERLPSDDEDDWSEDEEPKTPQKLDISQLMGKTGLQITKPAPSDIASKLSGLGLSIKKGTTPIKEEKQDNDLMQRLGKLGGIKLKLKSDGGNKNSFSVVNGLKDFNTSDDEKDAGSDEDMDHSAEPGSDAEPSDEEPPSRTSESEEPLVPINKSLTISAKLANAARIVAPKVEPAKDDGPSVYPGRRPPVKLTPVRPAPAPLAAPLAAPAAPQTQHPEIRPPVPPQPNTVQPESVVVKKELEGDAGSQLPLFSGQIKTERSSPPPVVAAAPVADTPAPAAAATVTEVKREPDPVPNGGQALFSPSANDLMSVTKKEVVGDVIEINGDSNDEDDDCCVVSATPAADVKPVVPKTEAPSYAAAYPNLHNAFSAPAEPPRPTYTTEKQHSFNWNAPDTKPLDLLEKSADDIFESLLSSTKKEGASLSDPSEYISLDRLGSQHTCDVCNTRFTDSRLLDDHIRSTGHSKSIIMPSSMHSSSSSMLPYNQSPLMSSLLPVKQLAEQVGKLSALGSGANAFTHQQNVMINIQAYPGGMAPPAYSSYQPTSAYQQPSAAYGAQYSDQQYSGQYGQYGQAQQQYGAQYPQAQAPYAPSAMQNMQQAYQSPMGMSQQGMSQQGMSQQGMSQQGMSQQGMSQQGMSQQGMSQQGMSQQSSAGQGLAGQSIQNMQNMASGQMGMGMSGAYIPTSSPGAMKPPAMPPPSGVRIQNVQTFPAPGGAAGRGAGGVGGRGAGARPRLAAGVRGARPSVRPGVQIQAQVRGPRAPAPRGMKRPAPAAPRAAPPHPGHPGHPAHRRDMLLPDKHDNEDCQVMAMQRQREGLPLIHSVQGARDKLGLGSQISITKKTVNKEASAMANVLASRGISVSAKQRSRSPSPERPVPHIPNLGAGVSIKHSSRANAFSIPEARVGAGMHSCKVCRKMFSSAASLAAHAPVHKQHRCDECPAAYPTALQLQHHRRVFHTVSGPNRELGIPVVDFSQPDSLQKLANLGIYSFIPLANREKASGTFGIPVMSVHNMQNGMVSSLQALGADGLLSLGPLKPLPNT